jgi:sulfofructose kinase
MTDVTGVGANSIDHVLRIPTDIHSLAASGKVRLTSQDRCYGGQTATTMAACAALGLRARYIGAFGSDPQGRRMRAELTARNVDVQHCVDAGVPNAGAVIIVDRTGSRTVIWHRDDGLGLAPAQIPVSVLKDSRLVHVDDVDRPAALRTCAMAGELGLPVTSDIEHVTDGVEELVRAVTHPIFDHHAPALLTGEADPERALRKLRRLNAGLLCMTLGDLGSAALAGDRFHMEPALEVTAVDTTGAGDVFRAGFIYGLLQKWDVPAMLRFANAAAAVSCGRPGAIASVPSRGDLETASPPMPRERRPDINS